MPRAQNDDVPDLDSLLPPLDGDAEEEPAEVDTGIGIDDAPASEHVGLDDELATELDVGIAIDEPDDADSDEAGELVLDIAELLDRAEERADDDDAGAGPADFDPSIGIDDLPDPAPDGAEEGLEEPADAFLDEELPDIDGDDDAQGEPALLEFDASPDEDLPVHSERPWAERTLAQPLEACVALDVGDSGVIAATAEQILWLSDEPVRRVSGDAARIHSVCRVGSEGVLYATVTGELLRRATAGGRAEPLANWRRAAGVAPDSPATLSLCRLGGTLAGVLAQTSAGALLVSDDAGDDFRSVELEGKVKALPRSAQACVVLVSGDAAPYLLASSDAGRTFRRIELDATARRVASGEAPCIAAAGPVIALAEGTHGVCVSADHGAHFVRAPGCGGATAVAVGRSAGRWLVVAALHREVLDVTHLVMIDPASGAAERIGELAAAATSEGLDAARIACMAFEEHALRLWAAGGFGVASWSPERLPN